MNFQRVFLLVVAIGFVPLTGCFGDGAAETKDTDTGATDAHGGGASPTDVSLANELRSLYTATPLGGGQDTPSHQWLVGSDGRLQFLHWNDADPAKATGLLFVGDGFFAKGCRGEGGASQADIDAGYVHFHKKTAPTWAEGHHADANPETEGVWLRHIAAMPGVDPMGVGASPVGSVYPLMPSYEEAPACTAQADTTVAQLLALYTDKPYTGGQDTPSHTWLVGSDGRISFLHWNNADPAKATGLLFTGDGFRAKGCVGEGGISQAQIDAGYVHFHKAVSPTWAEGHHTNTDANTDGFWLRHIAAAAGVDPMGVGASEVGAVYPLMPSHEDAPACTPLGIA